MALFQNPRILELENQLSELTIERDNFQIILEGLRREGVSLQKYEQMGQEIRQLKNEVNALNNRTADYYEQIKGYKLQLQYTEENAENKYKKEIEALKSQIIMPTHNSRGAGRKPITTTEDVALIINLHSQGNGITKIYKAVNMRFSKSTIHRIIKKSHNQN